MSDKSKRILLVAIPVIAFVILFLVNLSSYMGLYDDIVSVVLLASVAVILPAQVEQPKARFGWLLALSLTVTVAAVGLFALCKPAVSTKQASALLLEAGYTEIGITEGQRTYPLEEGGNWFVNKGYQYTASKEDGEPETVRVHPFTGELTVIEG
ncbi:MAG: hypothetical protein IK954_01525 [Clostridia bacterium]|nr:hypothetical protein [Clostridia bacterium]